MKLNERQVQIAVWGAKTADPSKISKFAPATVVDCRVIQNPAGLEHTEDFVLQSPALPMLLGSAVTNILWQSKYRKAGDPPTRVGVFCAYGVHRSVIVADLLAKMLNSVGVQTTVGKL